MILFLFSITVAFIIGWLTICCVLSKAEVPRYLYVVLALPTGWALTSVTYFLWIVSSGGKTSWYPAVEMVLFVALLIFSFRQHRKNKKSFWGQARWCKNDVLISLGFIVVTIVNFSIVVMKAGINPWGRWDAWARINVKARYLFGGEETWRWIFESSHIAHHDYPLLLASTVARIWSWTGEVSNLGPQIISIVWGLLSVLLLFFFVLWLRGPMLAMIIGLAYLTFFPVLFWSAGQYSDLPLVVYMVSASALLVASKGIRDHLGIVFLAGFFVGAAAWSKNEGIIFLACALVWWFSLTFRNADFSFGKATSSFLCGLSFPLFAVLVLKLFFAGKTDVIEGQISSFPQIYSLITDLERHRIIWNEVAFYLDVLWNKWALLVLLVGYMLYHARKNCRVAHVGPLWSGTVLSVVYYYVLITTPYDISWHVETALDRLILQLFPVLLFGLAVLFKEENCEGPWWNSDEGDTKSLE